MIGQHLLSSTRSEEDCRSAVEATNKDRAPRTYNFGPNVVSVDGLRIGLDVPDCAILVLQIDDTGYHVTVLRHLGPYSAGCVGMDLSYFIAHHPSRQVEIVDRIRVKNHSVYV